MTVAVQMPPQKESDLDQLAKILGIAGQVLGTVINLKDMGKAEKERAEDKAATAKSEAWEQDYKNRVLQKDLDKIKADRDIAETDKTRKIGNEKLDTATGLRKEYNNLSKETDISLSAYRDINTLATKPDSQVTASDDMSLIFRYMKMLDPGSTVREGEYAQAEQTRGIPESVVMWYNKALSGQKLSADQRIDFFNSAKKIVGSRLDFQKDTDSRYEGISKNYNVDSNLVLDPKYKKFSDEFSNSLALPKEQRNLSLPGENKAEAAKPFDPEAYSLKIKNMRR